MFIVEKEDFKIRFAEKKDAKSIVKFIELLASYEHLESQCIVTEKLILTSIFDHKEAEVILGELDGEIIAFSLFYHNYSTFLGRSNIFLEDLFVLKEHRHKGYGKIMLATLAKIACDRGAKRLDWWCLDWNTASIDFYKSIGADHLKEWTIFRLQHEKLEALANTI